MEVDQLPVLEEVWDEGEGRVASSWGLWRRFFSKPISWLLGATSALWPSGFVAVSLQPPPPFLHCVFPMHLVFSSSISRTIVLRFRACPIPGLSHLEISTLIKFAKIPFPRKTTFTSCRKTYLLGITIPPISYAGPRPEPFNLDWDLWRSCSPDTWESPFCHMGHLWASLVS